MKTLMTITISVGVSVMFMYYLMRRHNKLKHSKKCGCSKATVTIPKVLEPKGNPINVTDEPTPTPKPDLSGGDTTVGDLLDVAAGGK